MSDYVSITTDDGTFQAYRVLPAVTPAPTIVVLQEIFGINDDLKATCHWLADQGFIAVCPDLFWRTEPGVSLSRLDESEWTKGFQLYQKYDRDLGVSDVGKVLDAARLFPESSGKAGVMGYCLGGLMTFLAAARVGPDAAVSYYGGETDQYITEQPGIQCPMLIHLGTEDEFISPAAQLKITESVSENRNVKVYSYPGCKHAFARHNGVHFDAGAAELANARSLEFLRSNLG